MEKEDGVRGAPREKDDEGDRTRIGASHRCQKREIFSFLFLSFGSCGFPSDFRQCGGPPFTTGWNEVPPVGGGFCLSRSCYRSMQVLEDETEAWRTHPLHELGRNISRGTGPPPPKLNGR